MKSLIVLFAALFLGSNLWAQAQSNAQVEIQIQPRYLKTELQDRTIDRYSYNFGRVWLNSSSSISYRLTNTGTTPLTFQRATISGGNYSATHSCTVVLAPGDVCGFNIRFSPFFEGLSTGRFILSFVEDLDLVVDLWGEGYRM